MKKISFTKLVDFLNEHYDLTSVSEGDIWNEYWAIANYLNNSVIPATDSNIRRLAYGIAPYFTTYTLPCGSTRTMSREDKVKAFRLALVKQIRYFQKGISENCCEEEYI
jgi:hypothetical protein